MCPHGIQVGMPFGGVPQLTALDIAAALGMADVEDIQVRLLRVKFALDLGCYDRLRYEWMHRVVTHAVDEGWKAAKGKPRILPMAVFTLIEHLGWNCCPACHGNAERMVGDVKEICPTCDGTGKQYRSERWVAQHVLSVHHSTFQQTWRDRFNWCRGDLAELEDAAVRKLRSRIG